MVDDLIESCSLYFKRHVVIVLMLVYKLLKIYHIFYNMM